ncbi:MAG: transcriptional regulator with XRE-family HTH domain [Alteromonadaceae bacterium]
MELITATIDSLSSLWRRIMESKTLAIEFGKKVRNKRKSLGITQENLALICKFDRTYGGIIERGEVNITLEKVYRLAVVLECEVKDLLP